MADEEKKIIIDEDWKAEAQREKERVAEEQAQRDQESLPEPSFSELVNMVAIQALAGLGLIAGADGRPMPPNLEVAKHFIDMLQVLEDKTKGNLTADEKKLLDAIVYDMRMRYVQIAQGGGGGPTGAGGPAPGPNIEGA